MGRILALWIKAPNVSGQKVRTVSGVCFIWHLLILVGVNVSVVPAAAVVFLLRRYYAMRSSGEPSVLGSDRRLLHSAGRTGAS